MVTSLLVNLGSPIKEVRRAAIHCLQALSGVASQFHLIDLSCRTLKSISVFESRPCFPWAAPRQWLGLGRTLKPTCSWETWNSFIGQLWGQGFSTGSLGCPHLTSPLSFLRVRLTSLSDGYLSLPPISSLFPSCMPPSLYPLIQEFPFMRFSRASSYFGVYFLEDLV